MLPKRMAKVGSPCLFASKTSCSAAHLERPGEIMEKHDVS